MRSLGWPAPLFALFLVAAVHGPKPVGYVNVDEAMRAHPFHAVLATYAREIATLKETQNVRSLRDPAGAAERSAEAARETSVATTERLRTIASSGAIAAYQRAEERSLGVLLRSRGVSDSFDGQYRDQLVRATSANLTAFDDAASLRTQRAYTARAQELYESELTFGFDLAKQDAGRRLSLRLKLDDLHLDAEARAQLGRRLSLLDAAEARALTARKRSDATVLADYRRELERDAAAATAQTHAEIRSKAAANGTLRSQVAGIASNAEGATSHLPLQAAAFHLSYHPADDAAQIGTALRTASGDIAQRFSVLADVDRRSNADLAVQIAALQRERASLDRAMRAAIARDARAVAMARGLDLVVGGAKPHGSVDLTPSVAAELRNL